MTKKIARLVCKVQVEHKTKGQIRFLPHQGERPMLVYQSSPPIEGDEMWHELPPPEPASEPDPREIDPHKVADRVYQIMLAEARSMRIRGGA